METTVVGDEVVITTAEEELVEVDVGVLEVDEMVEELEVDVGVEVVDGVDAIG